jgi:hypothetical protein
MEQVAHRSRRPVLADFRAGASASYWERYPWCGNHYVGFTESLQPRQIFIKADQRAVHAILTFRDCP